MLLTDRVTAERLGISTRKLLKLVSAGTLAAYRAPGGRRRFRSEDVEAYLARPAPAPTLTGMPMFSRRRRGHRESDTPVERRIIFAEEAMAMCAGATADERQHAAAWVRHFLGVKRLRKGPYEVGDPTYRHLPAPLLITEPPAPLLKELPLHEELPVVVRSISDCRAQDNFLKKSEVAKRLGVSGRTIERWVASGALRAYRTPGGHTRFHPKEVEACLGMHVQETKPFEDDKASPPAVTAVTGDDGLKAVGAKPPPLEVSPEDYVRQRLAKKRLQAHNRANGLQLPGRRQTS